MTVGELREALAGLDDNAEVLAHDRPLRLAITGVAALELDPDVSIYEDALMAFRDTLESIANGGAGYARLADVRKMAAVILEDFPT